MSENVQLAIITLIVLIINTWRSEVAARRAFKANESAENAVKSSQQGRIESAAAIEQVHQAVNGGMAAAKAEIADLKVKLTAAKNAEERLEEIRGEAGQ